uniref:PX domain-containing protein n=1 Tax=Peronospora matthiolae TaxID=2874970 RepID=A0AAV1UQ32_9STRA
MPYESFKSSQHVAIRGLVQDRKTGTWRYLLHVTRHMQESDAGRFGTDVLASRSKKKGTPKQETQADMATARPCTTQAYAIRRSFDDFKRLYDAVAPLLMQSGKAPVPKMPNDSLLTFFVGETQTALQKKRLALERVLAAIEAHPAACDAPEYAEFVANLNSYDQVAKAPLSPSMSSRSSYSFSEEGTATPRAFGAAASVLPTSRSANALRRAYSQQDEDAVENRVAFSHFIEETETLTDVLSRVATSVTPRPTPLHCQTNATTFAASWIMHSPRDFSSASDGKTDSVFRHYVPGPKHLRPNLLSLGVLFLASFR